jgi:hypothetical protein
MTRRIFLLLLLLIALGALIISTPMVAADYDMWWHIKYGEIFVLNQTWFIDHSQFSWVPASADWPYVTWIGSSLIYGLFKIVSLQGMYILPLVGLLTVGALYFLHLKRQKVPVDELAIATFFFTMIVSFSQLVRPTIFSNIFFALCLLIYFSSRYSPSSKTYYRFLPFIFLLWVNTHGSFLMGLAFLTLACCLDAASNFLSKQHSNAEDRSKTRSLAIALLFSYGVLIINPYGFRYLFAIVDHLLFASHLEGQSGLITEYMSLWSRLDPTKITLRPMQAGYTSIAMMASLLLFSAYSYSKTKVIPVTILGLNILFFLSGMAVSRALVFFCLVWLFSFAQLISLSKDIIPRRKVNVSAAALTILFSLNAFYLMFSYSPMLSWFGPALYAEYPIKEVEFLLEHKLPAPLLNDYLSGGYLIWAAYPKYKVFIDSRGGPYLGSTYMDSFAIEKAKTPDDLRPLLNKYPAKTIFMNWGQMNVIDALLRMPEWKLVYFDKAAAIFVHESESALIRNLLTSTDMGPGRFSMVENPDKLISLFHMYSNLKSPAAMAKIEEIYARNVRSTYLMKRNDIKSMESIIKAYEKLPSKSF